MRILKLLFIPALFFMSVGVGYGCSCADPSIRQKFRSSSLIFVGQVSDIRDIPQTDARWKALYFYAVTLSVEKKWKGPSDTQIEVAWANDLPGMCNDLPLIKGERYLIYTNQNEYGYTVEPECGTNYRAKFRADEIKKLDNFWFRTSARLFPFPKL